MVPKRLYITGYLVEDTSKWPPPPFKGRGWFISYIDQRKKTGQKGSSHHISQSKEIAIYAPNYKTAQEAHNLLNAAITVKSGQLQVFGEFEYIQPADAKELLRIFDKDCLDEYGFGRYMGALGFPPACILAAKASHRRATKYALTKLKFSYDLISCHAVDMDPSFATEHYGKSAYSERHVRLGYATLSAYSAIEEIGLEIRASGKNPSLLKDGSWNPKVRDDLENRLQKAGVNIDETIPWVRRGKPTKVEKAKQLPSKGPCPWSKGPYIRDCEVELVDALRIADFIRDKITAHKLPEAGESLTLYDLENVRGLARRLLLQKIGVWQLLASRYYQRN